MAVKIGSVAVVVVGVLLFFLGGAVGAILGPVLIVLLVPGRGERGSVQREVNATTQRVIQSANPGYGYGRHH